MRSDAAGLLELAVAAAPDPVSIDTLVGWNVARPAELWAFFEAARSDGRLSEPRGGEFEFADSARRDETLARATPADWNALLDAPARISWAIEAARGAAARQRFTVAGALARALVARKPRDTFPGGVRGWLDIVLQSLRQLRAMTGIANADLEEAITTAIALGDVGAQGVLHGALAAAALRDGDGELARRRLATAREAARACTGPRRAEIHMYLALGLVLQGRPRAAVEAFEELLGDVPDDVASLVEPSSSAPATGLFVIAGAYARAGQVPRALDLIHRIRSLGVERDLPALEREADLFASIVHGELPDFAAAREHAEAAFAFYSATRSDPLHLWFAAQSLAAVRGWQGRTDEIPAILAPGLRAREASGWPWLAGSGVVALLEELDVQGVRVEGFELASELDRVHAGGNVSWRGTAARYRARLLARSGGEHDPVRIRQLLDEAVALLGEAGAAYELARALDDAAALAQGGGRTQDATRLRAQLREGALAGALPPDTAPALGPARLAAILIELGRLGSLSARHEGTWGEIAARLCRALRAERCALIEAGDPPRLLAVRGGTGAWRDAVTALVAARAPAAVEALPSPESPGDAGKARLLVVPFAAEDRRGWACLESRHGTSAIGPEDAELLEVLSAQLGILLGNVALWQELSRARERVEEENRYWRSTTAAAAPGSRIVGDSPALRRVLDLVSRVAPATTPVLVTGETGVGKELVASEIHRQSPRRHGPFIAVHVASLAPGLVASGLFGHERGAFTGATEQAKGRFELADGGTLFLDEVGELAAEDQVRLLRVLQEGSFERVGGTRPLRSDFRLVAATNRDLEAEVRAGRFREDLYYRLAGFPLRVPPLRERREEIPTLALFFMERASRARGARFEGIGEADMRRLVEYPWPGNVRELEHVIERAAVLSEPPRLRIPTLDPAARPLTPAAATAATAAPPPAGVELSTLADAERRHIAAVLRHVRGRITGAGGAAEILGLKPSTLNFRIRKLGLGEEVRRARAVPRA